MNEDDILAMVKLHYINGLLSSIPCHGHPFKGKGYPLVI